MHDRSRLAALRRQLIIPRIEHVSTTRIRLDPEPTPSDNTNKKEETMRNMTSRRSLPLKLSIFTDVGKGPVPHSSVKRFATYMEPFLEKRYLAIHTLSLSERDTSVLYDLGDRFEGRISLHPVGADSEMFPLKSHIARLVIADPRPMVQTVREGVYNAIGATHLVVLFPDRPMTVTSTLRDMEDTTPPLTTRALIRAKATRRATLIINPNDTPPVLLFTNNLERSVRPPSSMYYGTRQFRARRSR